MPVKKGIFFTMTYFLLKEGCSGTAIKGYTSLEGLYQ